MITIMDIILWNREFSLEVRYDCYEGETIISEQIKMVKDFESHPGWLKKARRYIEKYCERDVEADKENCKGDNIFRYIKPEYIFVKHDEVHPRIALMCKYRYDLEHGLAVVFSADGDVSVGLQDIIL